MKMSLSEASRSTIIMEKSLSIYTFKNDENHVILRNQEIPYGLGLASRRGSANCKENAIKIAFIKPSCFNQNHHIWGVKLYHMGELKDRGSTNCKRKSMTIASSKIKQNHTFLIMFQISIIIPDLLGFFNRGRVFMVSGPYIPSFRIFHQIFRDEQKKRTKIFT